MKSLLALFTTSGFVRCFDPEASYIKNIKDTLLQMQELKTLVPLNLMAVKIDSYFQSYTFSWASDWRLRLVKADSQVCACSC